MRGLADAEPAGPCRSARAQPDDFTPGLLDAWAAVLDTLGLYAEIQANENYLRTATLAAACARMRALSAMNWRRQRRPRSIWPSEASPWTRAGGAGLSAGLALDPATASCR